MSKFFRKLIIVYEGVKQVWFVKSNNFVIYNKYWNFDRKWNDVKKFCDVKEETGHGQPVSREFVWICVRNVLKLRQWEWNTTDSNFS